MNHYKSVDVVSVFRVSSHPESSLPKRFGCSIGSVWFKLAPPSVQPVIELYDKSWMLLVRARQQGEMLSPRRMLATLGWSYCWEPFLYTILEKFLCEH